MFKMFKESKLFNVWIAFTVVTVLSLGGLIYIDWKELNELEAKYNQMIGEIEGINKSINMLNDILESSDVKKEEEIKIDYKESELYVSDWLNVRTGKGTEFEVEDVLSKGDKIKIFEVEGEESDWVLVDTEKELYVHKDYLSETKPVEEVEEKTDENVDNTRSISDGNNESGDGQVQEDKVASATTSAWASMNINNRSGLSASEIDRKLAGTNLSGIGWAIEDVENTYGINAYFTMAVASHESGNGNSNLAVNNNNLFGFKAGDGWASYGSKGDSVYAFGKNISKNYIGQGLSSISSINGKYCPGDGGYWTGKIVWFMNHYIGK